jgi:hypothetical protein
MMLDMSNLKRLALDAVGQRFMDATADFHDKEILEIKSQYPGLSHNGAMDVSYLRTRSRHSEALEKRLVASHMEGKVVMICDWPSHEDRNYDPMSGKPL